MYLAYRVVSSPHSALGIAKQVSQFLPALNFELYRFEWFHCFVCMCYQGAHFDLRPLQITKGTDLSYSIEDGDIPCTPEEEPSYDYVWNFCDSVSDASLPSYCSKMGKTGVVLQHVQYDTNLYYCYILGHFDAKKDEVTYGLLDEHDPSKGVSIRYPSGELCSPTNPYARTATIRVECANVPAVVSSAQEPSICSYELSMKSYYGCPTVCFTYLCVGF